MEEARYNSIKETPNVITAVSDKGDGLSMAVFITKTNKPMKDKKAPIRCVNPLVGSRKYLFIKKPP